MHIAQASLIQTALKKQIRTSIMYPSIRIKNQKQKWDNQTTNKITTKNVIQNKVGFKSTNNSQML